MLAIEREHEQTIYLRDTVNLDDAEDAVRRCLGEDE